MLLLFDLEERASKPRRKKRLWWVSMLLFVLAGRAAVIRYRDLKKRRRVSGRVDPLLLLRGSGKRLWATEHADDYVRRLRQGSGMAGISR